MAVLQAIRHGPQRLSIRAVSMIRLLPTQPDGRRRTNQKDRSRLSLPQDGRATAPEPSTIQPSRSQTSRYVLFVLLLILIIGAAIRVSTFRGFAGLDDSEYARFAALMAEGREFPGDYAGPGVFPLRVGVIVPTAILFRMLGVSEWASVLYPLALSLSSIALLFVCASLFYGPRGGLIAAAMLATYYTEIDTSTRLLPDLPGAFFSLLAVTLVLVSAQRGSTRYQLWWGGVAAGLSFGVSWLCKESVAYMVPFCLALMFLTLRRGGRSVTFLWMGLAAASLSVLLVEAFTYYASTGDLLFRLHQVEDNYRQWERGFFAEGSVYGWAAGTSHSAAVVRRLFLTGPAKILFDPALYYLPFLGLVAATYGWWRRDESFLIPGVWLCSLILIFNFGSTSFSAYIPLALYYRYLHPMYFPAIVLVSGLFVKTLFAHPLGTRRVSAKERLLGFAVLIALLSAAIPQIYQALKHRPVWTDEVRTLRRLVTPHTVVYADAITLRAFEFYNGYPEKTAWTDFEHLASLEEIRPGSLVIVNRRYLQWLNQNAGLWVAWPPGPTSRAGYRRHPFYDAPPVTWMEVWENANTRVYRTDAPDSSLTSGRQSQ